jgi:predicted phage baseplate assembly protein
MSATRDPSLQGLNDCGCCTGITTQTPVEVTNRAGLSAIAYRVGTYAQFKQSLLACLSASHHPGLKGLTTREENDFAIAFLDACAVGADVLTFYSERILNEAYLRTATERFSLLEMARLIGYELRPGVAASTYLTFTVEEALGSSGTARIDVGAKVQSVPQQGEQAQMFETVESRVMRAEWNAIKPRLTRPQLLSQTSFSLLLQGIDTKLKTGDLLWIVTATDKIFRRIRKVTVESATQQTRVEIQAVPLSAPSYPTRTYTTHPRVQEILKLGIPKLTVGTIQANISQFDWQQSNLASVFDVGGFNRVHLKVAIAAQQSLPQTPTTTGVYVFRTVAALFGYNAPQQVLTGYVGAVPQFAAPTLAETSNQVSLDNAYDGIIEGSYVAAQQPGQDLTVYQVKAVETRPRTSYGLSGKTTILTVQPNWNLTSFELLRETMVYAQSEPLELVDEPIPEPVDGHSILLNGFFPELQVGQKVMLTGKRIDLPVTESEVMTIADIRTVGGYTQLNFLKNLENRYHRQTVTLNANVVLSTHGETVHEVLGSGDASQPQPKFTLRQPPLTYIGAATPGGTTSTLQVRVNDLLWHEVSTLYGKGPQERVYVTQTRDDSKTTLVFNRELPTGQDNVKATYRKGIGLGGLVELNLLMTRPLGVKAVTNPQPSRGAENPEGLEQARQNAPLTVLTLDRIVSLQDYEDFTRAFAGISKALATWTWDGQQQSVFVTVAGPKGAAISPSSPLYIDLVDAIRQASDRYIPLQVQSYRLAFFRIKASIRIDPDYLLDQALIAVWEALQNQFGFDARAFGQVVALSEVIATIQAVAGIVAVDVDQFYRFGETEDLQSRLAAAVPQAGTRGAAAAELLILDPNSSPDDLRGVR